MALAAQQPIGILGGMGPLATSAFYASVIRATQAKVDQQHLHVIIDADPAIPDRSNFLLGRGPDPRPRLMAAARRLHAGGVELAAMPCNTAAAFELEIQEASELRLVPWVTTAIEDVRGRGFRRAGILATEGTIRVGLYQEALRTYGMDAVTPASGDQARLTEAIYGPGGVKARGLATAGAKTAVLDVGRRLADAGAECLILGCTELPLTVSAESPHWLVPVIDPAPVVARRLVYEAQRYVA